MHARWLVEIATLLVVQPRSESVSFPGSESSPYHRYWVASRQRVERWQERLSIHRDQLEHAGASRRVQLWTGIRPTLEEILLSEVLTRIAAAYVRTMEDFESTEAIGLVGNERRKDHLGRTWRHEPARERSPFVHGVFQTQIDIRHRCLRMLLTPGLPVEQSLEINRLRHSLEQWTDTFLAQLGDHPQVMAYAFAPERTLELAREAAERTSDSARFVAWQLMASSCQRWMRNCCPSIAANPALNREIGESVLSIMHPDRFPSFTPVPSLARDRVTTLIDQADHWVSQVI